MRTPLHVIEGRRRTLAIEIAAAAVGTFGALAGAVTAILVGASIASALALVVVAVLALAVMLLLLSRWHRVEHELEVVAELRGEQQRVREAQRVAMARAFAASTPAAPRPRG